MQDTDACGIEESWNMEVVPRYDDLVDGTLKVEKSGGLLP